MLPTHLQFDETYVQGGALSQEMVETTELCGYLGDEVMSLRMSSRKHFDATEAALKLRTYRAPIVVHAFQRVLETDVKISDKIYACLKGSVKQFTSVSASVHTTVTDVWERSLLHVDKVDEIIIIPDSESQEEEAAAGGMIDLPPSVLAMIIAFNALTPGSQYFIFAAKTIRDLYQCALAWDKIQWGFSPCRCHHLCAFRTMCCLGSVPKPLYHMQIARLGHVYMQPHDSSDSHEYSYSDLSKVHAWTSRSPVAPLHSWKIVMPELAQNAWLIFGLSTTRRVRDNGLTFMVGANDPSLPRFLYMQSQNGHASFSHDEGEALQAGPPSSLFHRGCVITIAASSQDMSFFCQRS